MLPRIFARRKRRRSVALDRLGIPVAEVIVNRVIPDALRVRFATGGQMSGASSTASRDVWARSGRFDRAAAVVNRAVSTSSAKIGKYTCRAGHAEGLAQRCPRSHSPSAGVARRACRVRSWGPRAGCAGRLRRALAAPESSAIDGARILLFGGKGGVGKTTTARRLPCGCAWRIDATRAVDVNESGAIPLATCWRGGRRSSCAVRGAPKIFGCGELDAAGGRLAPARGPGSGAQ